MEQSHMAAENIGEQQRMLRMKFYITNMAYSKECKKKKKKKKQKKMHVPISQRWQCIVHAHTASGYSNNMFNILAQNHSSCMYNEIRHKLTMTWGQI